MPAANTVYNMQKFVKSLPAKYDGFFDWEFLNPLFPGKIEITDVDGLVERNGHFLVFETKALMAMIPRGQQLAHEAMLRTGLFSVIHIWGDNAEEWRLYQPSGYIVDGNGKADLMAVVSRWVAYAESKK